MPRVGTIAVTPCSTDQLDTGTSYMPARQVYLGDHVARTIAAAKDPVFLISAKDGLFPIDQPRRSHKEELEDTGVRDLARVIHSQFELHQVGKVVFYSKDKRWCKRYKRAVMMACNLTRADVIYTELELEIPA